MWCTVGIHPHHAGEEPVPSPETVAALADHPRVVGIGEVRARLLLRPLASFRAAGRDFAPISVPRGWPGCRSSSTRGTRTRTSPPFWRMNGIRAVASTSFCTASVRAGHSRRPPSRWAASSAFSGILTFPKSHAIREIARDLPSDRLLVETDAPYLAPVPFRGKRNEPAWTAHTAKVLAQVRELSAEALAELTTANFRRLFRKTA